MLQLADSGDHVTEVPARGLTRTPAETATPWRMPLLDRTGTTLTVWLPPANKCHRTVPRAPEVIESTHSVVVRANAGTAAEACEVSTWWTPVTVALPSPLNRRRLVDGYDNDVREPLRADRAPRPPAGWDAYPVQLRPVAGTELAWDFGYNQAGADLHILVIRGQDGGAPPTTLATETVNGHEAAIYTRAGGLEYVARWQAGELEFTVEVTPPEGGSTDLAAFRQLLRQLSWD